MKHLRAELALIVLYLSKAEARDKICRAIQYGSKFMSNGQAGTAQDVDKSTSLARKVFRLFKFVNDLQALISPPSQGTPLPLILLGKNKEHTEKISRISLFYWMGSSVCTTIIELAEIKRLSSQIKNLEKDMKLNDKQEEHEQYLSKVKQSNDRLLSLIKSSMDIVVAAGLLQLAPKTALLE